MIQGDPVKLICAAVGRKPELRWYHGTAEVSYSHRVVNENNPKDGFACLHIKRSLPEDAGQYILVAKNDKEQVEAKCNLQVITSEEFIKPDPDKKNEDQIEPIFITGIKGNYFELVNVKNILVSKISLSIGVVSKKNSL